MTKKIVFCGGGNMAEGMIKGLINNGGFDPDNITVNELNSDRCQYLSDTHGVKATPNVSEYIKDADLIIIAVNPSQVSSVTKNLKTMINEKTIVMSIVAAVKIETLESQIGRSNKVVRITPNTLIQAQSGYSAVCFNDNCNDKDKVFVDEVLKTLGQIMHIKEDMFNAFTSFSNVGPLWFYKMVEALIDGGVYAGFNRIDARNIILKNMAGVASILDETGDHPAIRSDNMTSPGGVTIEALKALQDEGFYKALMNSVAASVNKVKSLD